MQGTNLLLFGCDFFSTKKASEINFWQDMVEELRDRYEEIVVLSVNNRRIHHERLYDNVHLYNIAPRYLGNLPAGKDLEYSGKGFHRLPLATIYKTYSFVTYLPLFDELIKKHNIGSVHYMRVFGLLNRRLVKRHRDVSFSITVPTHVDRGFPLHRAYHAIKNAALGPMDKVIATSRATRDRLQELGIEKDKLEVIPWTVQEQRSSATEEETDEIRAELGIPAGTRIVLWSGPLQGTGTQEFLHSLSVARLVTARTDRFAFVFAFKPDTRAGLAAETQPSPDGIKILETDRAAFARLKAATSAFLSPVCNRNRTVAPPLTWIEMMGHGIPVITTPVAGADELITDRVTGFIVDGIAATAELLLKLDFDLLKEMGIRCAADVAEKHDIRRIADRYAEVWSQSERRRGV